MRRRLALARGLAAIGLHERLGERAGRRLSGFARRRAQERAARRVPPLRPWERISERSFERYRTGGSAVRIARLLDLVEPGSRILDIGVGHGYITGVILRDLRPARYCGVDLRPAFAESTRQMLAANGLTGAPAEIVVSDIFELDPGFWERHDPQVVLMLEMLEHVTDPARALRLVAAAVRPGTRIIFTVPMFGHLDHVWGHRSAFDRRRLMALCAAAGLEVERAEPLGSVWSLVVARTTGPPPAGGAEGPEPGWVFERVKVPDATDGAIRLEMPAPRVVRLDLEGGGALRVRGLTETGEAELEWAGEGPGAGKRRVFVLRPGRGDGELRATRRGKPDVVRFIEVKAEPAAGAQGVTHVRRAAYLGTPP